MKLAVLLSAMTAVSAWSVTFHDHDHCANGTTFHYGGGGDTGSDHVGDCFTMTSIDNSFANYDAKSVDIVFGGCSMTFFTDYYLDLGPCTTSNNDNWKGFDNDGDGCKQ
ncbi:hypothetical protein CORC01_08850 [Colletotrichum orchidophilum]|uniref:Uncharacterized protein n=1 Tax=Colletotrichum orchidophilum TaxID=1209926 RepID=A0A1G4B3E1_9PEZI|nr:uncharacterized protein CORC01_08850 [Colletotrichum orchidophilum]OHE95853.1 hypothetical protein CORC01_08850 [Colletotrichum orchidophilum]